MMGRPLDRSTFLRISWSVAGICAILNTLHSWGTPGFDVKGFNRLTVGLLVGTIYALTSAAIPAIAATWFIRREDFDAKTGGLLLATIVAVMVAGLPIVTPQFSVGLWTIADLSFVAPLLAGPLIVVIIVMAGRNSAAGSGGSQGRGVLSLLLPATFLLLATPVIAEFLRWVFFPAASIIDTFLGSWLEYIMITAVFYPHIYLAVALLWLSTWHRSFEAKRRAIGRGVVTLVVLSIVPLVLHSALRLDWGWAFYMPFYGLAVLAIVVIRVLK